MNLLLRSLLRVKFEYRSVVANEPNLAVFHYPNVWWQQYKILLYYREFGASIKECVVGPHTEFVLDGFQGSGNSFAAAAFKRSQTRPVMVAHHMHSSAQIIKAMGMGLPTLVTIREPRATVISLTSRWPYISMPQALRNYVRFYEKLEPYVDGFVLSSFAQTTGHLDDAIQEVNRRFKKDFNVVHHTASNMQALRSPEKLSSDREVKRKALKAKKAEELKAEACQELLAQAEAVYQRLESCSVRRNASSTAEDQRKSLHR